MKSKLIALAKLTQVDLDKIGILEKKIGVTLLAYSWCQGPELANLDQSSLELVKELEEELGINLVALEDRKVA